MGIDIYSTSLFCGMGDSDGFMLLHFPRIIRRLKQSFPGAVVYSPKNWLLEMGVHMANKQRRSTNASIDYE